MAGSKVSEWFGKGNKIEAMENNLKQNIENLQLSLIKQKASEIFRGLLIQHLFSENSFELYYNKALNAAIFEYRKECPNEMDNITIEALSIDNSTIDTQSE